MSHRIYLASSWRNETQPATVLALRRAGHEVYDFRRPYPGGEGFSWSRLDPMWQHWRIGTYAAIVPQHPAALASYAHDKRAMDWADTCVLLLPCGKSAHLEAGYMAGQNKRVIVLLHEDGFEPELMYLLCNSIVCNLDEALTLLGAT